MEVKSKVNGKEGKVRKNKNQSRHVIREARRTFLISYVSFSTEIVSPYYLHPERRPEWRREDSSRDWSASTLWMLARPHTRQI